MFMDQLLSYSNELQIGKAAEHLVCADLILQGYCAFLTDQDIPYDIIIENNNKLYKMQVKSCSIPKSYMKNRSAEVYTFGLKTGKHGNIRIINDIDYFAFVAMDIKTIAYMSNQQLKNKNNEIKMIVQFKTNLLKYLAQKGTYIQDYTKFEIK